jgi:hypothetical protein
MTSLTQRLSGAVLVLGGLLTAVGYVLMPTTSKDSAIVPASWLVLFGTLFILVSLPSFHVGQADRAGGLGWWGATVLSVGIGMANLPVSLLGVADRRALDDDSAFHSSSAGTIQFSGLGLVGVGLILLSIATFRARVYPSWVAWTVVSSLVITVLCQVVPPIGSALHFPAEAYLIVAAMGVAVIRGGTVVPVEHDERVRVPAA